MRPTGYRVLSPPPFNRLPRAPHPPVRYAASLLALSLLLAACSGSTRDSSRPQQLRVDTLSRYADGTPQNVTVRRGDSVVERRSYRPTGRLQTVTTPDSVHTYFDLHPADSAAVLKDYLQGRWRNLSADTARPRSSVFYVFQDDRLTFEASDRTALESLQVAYKDHRRLVTNEGMSVRARIASFDTVRVTGYTLIRLAPPDSL